MDSHTSPLPLISSIGLKTPTPTTPIKRSNLDKDWIYFACTEGENVTWYVTHLALAAEEEELIANDKSFQENSNFRVSLSASHPMVQSAREKGQAERELEYWDYMCESIADHLQTFRQNVLEKLLAKPAGEKHKGRASYFSKSDKWRELCVARTNGEVKVLLWGADSLVQGSVSTKRHKSTDYYPALTFWRHEKLHGKYSTEIVTSDMESAEIAYLAFVLTAGEENTIASRFPLLVQALRDNVTTNGVGIAPLCDFSDVDIMQYLSATVSTVSAPKGTPRFSSKPGLCVHARASFKCGVYQSRMLRGALASFITFLVHRHSVKRLIRFLCLPVKPYDPLKMDERVRMERDMDTFETTFLKVFQEPLSIVVSAWRQKTEYEEGLVTKGVFFNKEHLPPNSSLLEKMTAIGEPKPITLKQVFMYLNRWMWREKYDDMKRALVAVIYSGAWKFVMPLILADMVAEAHAAFTDASVGGGAALFKLQNIHEVFDDHLVRAMALVGLILIGDVIDAYAVFTKTMKIPFGDGMITMMRFKLASHLTAIPQLFHSMADLARIMAVMQNDVPIMSDAVKATMVIVESVCKLFALYALLFVLNYRMAVVVGVLTPGFMYLVISGSLTIARLNFKFRNSEKNYLSRLEEMLKNWGTIRVLGHMKDSLAGVQKSAVGTRGNAAASKLFGATNMYRIQILNVIQDFFVFGLGGYFVTDGTLKIGEFMAFFMSTNKITNEIMVLTRSLTTYSKAQGSMTVILSILSLRPEDFRLQRDLPDVRGIQAKQVEFYYDLANLNTYSRPTLRGINFFIPYGRKVGLMGKSGSGKSTLLSLLARLLQPTLGTITVDGIPLNEVNINKFLTLVQQDALLFDDSILNNLLVGVDSKPSDEMITEVLTKAKFLEDVEAMPQKLQFSIGANGSRLSGGQRQRLSVARGILCDRPFLMLDEPTSAQDPETQTSIAKTLSELTRLNDPESEVTVITISHSLEFFQNFDWMMVVGNNTILEYDLKENLIQKKGEFFRMLNQQSGISVASNGRASLSPARLQQLWMFIACQPEELHDLAKLFMTRNLSNGETIYKPGDLGDQCFVLVKGGVDETWELDLPTTPATESTMSKAGDEEEGAEAKEVKPKKEKVKVAHLIGESFNEDCILEAREMDSTATAVGKTVILSLNQMYFEQAMASHPDVDEKIRGVVKRRKDVLAPRFLRQIWPFAQLDNNELMSLAFRCKTDAYTHSVLFESPEDLKHLYMVVHGSISLTIGHANDVGCDTQILGPGQFLGEMNCIGLVDNRLLAAEVAQDSVLVSLSHQDLESLYLNNPSIRARVQSQMALRSAWVDQGISDHWLLARTLDEDKEGFGEMALQLKQAMVTSIVPAGAQLWSNLSPCSSMIKILSGTVLETRCSPTGDMKWSTNCEAGSTCGDLSLTAANTELKNTCTLSAEVQESAMLCTLSREDFQLILSSTAPALLTSLTQMCEVRRRWLEPASFDKIKVKKNNIEDLVQEMMPQFIRATKPVFTSPSQPGWLGVTLDGEVTWKDGHATQDQGFASREALQSGFLAATPVATQPMAGDGGAVVLAVDLSVCGAAREKAKQEELKRIQAAEKKKQLIKTEISQVRRQIQILRKTLAVNNLGWKGATPAIMELDWRSAVRRESEAAVRWYVGGRRVKMMLAFKHAGDNEVGSYSDTMEYLKEMEAEYREEVDARRAKLAPRLKELEKVWRTLDEKLTEEQTFFLEADDVSVYKSMEITSRMAAAEAEVASRLAEVRRSVSRARGLATDMTLKDGNPLVFTRADFPEHRGIRTPVMENLRDRMTALQDEKHKREEELAGHLEEMTQAANRVGESFSVEADADLAEVQGLVSQKSLDTHRQKRGLMSEKLRNQFSAMQVQILTYYSNLRIEPEKQKPMTLQSEISVKMFDELVEEENRLKEITAIVRRMQGGAPLPPPPPKPTPAPKAPPPKPKPAGKGVSSAAIIRHGSLLELLAKILDSGKAPNKAERIAVHTVKDVTVQSLNKLEDEIEKLLRKLGQDSDEKRASLECHLREVEKYLIDIEFLDGQSKDPQRLNNKGGVLLYEENVRKHAFARKNNIGQIHDEIHTDLDAWESANGKLVVNDAPYREYMKTLEDQIQKLTPGTVSTIGHIASSSSLADK